MRSWPEEAVVDDSYMHDVVRFLSKIPHTGCICGVHRNWLQAPGSSKFVCHGTNAGTLLARGALNSCPCGLDRQGW
eukprot:7601272-Prorocentrum_lima.AAC.1